MPKEMWGLEVLEEELGKAYNDLATVPKRHLKKLKRALEMHQYMNRVFLADKLDLSRLDAVQASQFTAHVQGEINAMGVFAQTIQSILDDAFKPVERVSPTAHEREEEYRDEFYDE